MSSFRANLSSAHGIPMRRARLQVVALAVMALALVFSPYIALAIWQLAGRFT